MKISLNYPGLKVKHADFTLNRDTPLPEFKFPCKERNAIAQDRLSAPGAVAGIPHDPTDFVVEKVIANDRDSFEEWILGS